VYLRDIYTWKFDNFAILIYLRKWHCVKQNKNSVFQWLNNLGSDWRMQFDPICSISSDSGTLVSAYAIALVGQFKYFILLYGSEKYSLRCEKLPYPAWQYIVMQHCKKVVIVDLMKQEKVQSWSRSFYLFCVCT
jgi:hypothetical protein